MNDQFTDDENVELFDMDNTEGFDQEQLDKMNEELITRLNAGELSGIPLYERTNIISRDICLRF